MRVDLDNLNPGVFFPFEDDKDEGGVTIRLASGEAIAKIDKKCIKKRTEWRRSQRHEIVEDDNELRSRMLWSYVIVSWKGLYDSDGKEIPCTDVNKVKLMLGSVKFAAFVGSCVEKLTEESELYDEELEKNSSA